jgi:ribosomal protein S18 acetylase RimI-like enzyme
MARYAAVSSTSGSPIGVRIRRGLIDDAKEAGRAHLDTWRGSYRGLVPDALLDGLDEALWVNGWRRGFEAMDPTRVAHVAEVDGTVVGLATGGRARPGAPAEFRGEVYALYVRPEHQGRAIGRALLRAAAEELIERGLVPIVIWTLFNNPRSRGFYESRGGRVIGEKREVFEGHELHEVAYGWFDPAPLISPS